MSRVIRVLMSIALSPVLFAACSDAGPAREAGPIVWNYQRCPLDLALVNASHVVGVDAASGDVTSVEHVRTTDPRADVFAQHPIGPGVPVKFTRSDEVEGFADAGPTAVALVSLDRISCINEHEGFLPRTVSHRWTSSSVAAMRHSWTSESPATSDAIAARVARHHSGWPDRVSVCGGGLEGALLRITLHAVGHASNEGSKQRLA